MDLGEEVCDGSPHGFKKTHINLEGRMLTASLGGVTTTFQKIDCFFYMDVLGNTSMYPSTTYPNQCPDMRTEKMN